MAIDAIKSDLLDPSLHGFFTRRGGTSRGIYTSLNCGQGSSDDPDAVAANRGRVAAALSIEPGRLVSLHQHHSADSVEITQVPDASIMADAMVCRTPGIGLAILTADCAPILFSSDDGSVVGAAHAGWKGALGGVIEATVHMMARFVGGPETISAVIGPCISENAYEVGPEFQEAFLAEAADNTRYFKRGRSDRFQFNLPDYCIDRLKNAGLSQVSWTGHCTYADSERFFSYRRTVHEEQSDYGRMLSVIRARC